MATLRQTIDRVFGSAWHTNHKNIFDGVFPAVDGTVEANKPVVADANKTISGLGALTAQASITFAEGANIAAGSTTGSMIGTATSQKLGFFGATPAVQPTSGNEAAASTASITAVVTTAATSTTAIGYTTTAQANAIPTAINSLITQVATLTTLANQLRADAVTLGLIKGS